MSKKLVLQLLVVSAFAGTKITASSFSVNYDGSVTVTGPASSPSPYVKAIKNATTTISSQPFTVGIYNGSSNPVWLSDDKGNKYGSPNINQWISIGSQSNVRIIYVFTNSSYTGPNIALYCKSTFTNPDNTTGYTISVGNSDVRPNPTSTISYPGISKSSIRIDFDGNTTSTSGLKASLSS